MQQRTPSAGLKRPRPPSPDAEPQPLPRRPLPTAVWEDHLLPLLTCKDAARLGCTCKALRGVVRGHVKNLRTIKVEQLQAALTSFPMAQEVTFKTSPEGWRNGEKEALLQWLREGGRGGHLRGMELNKDSPKAADLVHKALQAGALPSLKRVDAGLADRTQRASLTQGFLRDVHELRLTFQCMLNPRPMAPQLAALGLVRQLPSLTKLEVSVCGHRDTPVEWLPFIPPQLKALRIDLQRLQAPTVLESLLHALPGMLGASGARLERLEVLFPFEFEALGDGLVHLAQALRCCAPTLKDLLLTTGMTKPLYVDNRNIEADEHTLRVERLRVHWADVLAGVSACRELQVLVLPYIDVESLFPPGTAFSRLTHLEISDHEREHVPDAGMMGLWDLMASGGLPALAKLGVKAEGQWGGGGGGEDPGEAGVGGRGRHPDAPAPREGSLS
jgi:hypothetical protein